MREEIDVITRLIVAARNNGIWRSDPVLFIASLPATFQHAKCIQIANDTNEIIRQNVSNHGLFQHGYIKLLPIFGQEFDFVQK